MPVFPLDLTSDGARIDLGVSPPQGYLTPRTRPRSWRALIDTGAAVTAVSPSVVLMHQPPQIGVLYASRAGGVASRCASYEIRLSLGGHLGKRRWFALEAMEIQPATPGVDILIGMDLLIKLELTWLGPARRAFLSY
jgi:hypothetical protein